MHFFNESIVCAGWCIENTDFQHRLYLFSKSPSHDSDPCLTHLMHFYELACLNSKFSLKIYFRHGPVFEASILHEAQTEHDLLTSARKN
jgi:hypothetical protein